MTVINVGDAGTEPTIRKALAIGATDAVRVNASPRDAHFVARQIASYAGNNNFDLVLTGRESIDYNGSQVAAMVGEFMGIPSVSIVKSLQVEGGNAILEREIEGGKEIIHCPLPLVVSASEGMAEPRIPNMRGIMAARTKPLTVVPAVAVNPMTTVKKFALPPAKSACKMLDVENAGQLIELLHNEAKVI